VEEDLANTNVMCDLYSVKSSRPSQPDLTVPDAAA
jgi:hypothetical protein